MSEPRYPVMRLAGYDQSPPEGDGDEQDILRDEDDLRAMIKDFGSAMVEGETFVDTAGQRWRISAEVDVAFSYHRIT